MMEIYDQKAEVRATKFMVAFAFSFVVGGVVVLLYQSILWLRDGYWTEILLRDYIPENINYDWSGQLGLRKIWDWAMSSSVWGTLICFGALLSFGPIHAMREAKARLAQLEARKRD